MQYKTRRDHLVDILHEEFDLQISPARDGIWKGADVYTAYQKVSGVDIGEKFNRKEMFSFVPPTSGMFIWVRDIFCYVLALLIVQIFQIKLHLESLTPDQGNEESLEVQLWTKIAEAGVLLAPGWIFSANVLSGDGPADGEGHFRISFSNTEVGLRLVSDAHKAKVDPIVGRDEGRHPDICKRHPGFFRHSLDGLRECKRIRVLLVDIKHMVYLLVIGIQVSTLQLCCTRI